MKKEQDMFFDRIPPRRTDKSKGVSREIESEVRFILNSSRVSDGQGIFDFMNVRRKGAKEIEVFLKENYSMAKPAMFGNVVSIFSDAPFRFTERETIAAIAELFADEAVVLSCDDERLSGKRAPKYLGDRERWGRLTLYSKKEVGNEDFQKAAACGRLLFDCDLDPLEDTLVDGLKRELKKRRDESGRILDEIKGVRFPGEGIVYNGRRIIHGLLSMTNDKQFVRFFNENKNELSQFEDAFSELKNFRVNIDTWKKLIESLEFFKPNLPVLENDPEAKELYDRMVLVSSSAKPSAFFGEIDSSIARLEIVNDRVMAQIRERVVSEIENKLESMRGLLKRKKASPRISNETLHPLRQLGRKARTETFLPDLEKIARDAAEHCEESVFLIEEG